MLDTIGLSLSNGQFTIENNAACACSIVWSLSDDKKELICFEEKKNCHHSSTLKVDEEPIMTITHGDPVYFVFNQVEIKDIPSTVIQKMMSFNQEYNQPHLLKKRQALVNWLMDCGYKIETEKKRGKYILFLLDNGKFWRNPEFTAGIFADAFLKKSVPFTYRKTKRF